MNSISWQATPTAESTAVEKEGSLVQKFSVPRRLITGIGFQFFHSAVIYLANDLTAQLPLQFFSYLRV